MSHQLLLPVLLIAVLYSTYLHASITPWDPPPDCATWKCDDTIGTTLADCAKKHGTDRAKFYPNGSICGCPVCMKVLKEAEDCTELTIMDKAVYLECDSGLSCDFSTRKCIATKND